MKIRMLVLAGLAALALAAWAQAAEDAATGAPAPTEPQKRTVFAAPFENETGQEQYDPAGAGLGDLVAVLLAQQQHVTVVERQRLLALAEEQARSLKGLTGDKYALEAGKLLKADTVLVGRLFLVQGKMTVHARAIDIASERVLAADELACRPEDLIEAALQMARRLAKQMALPLPEIDLAQIDASPIASLHFAKALSHYYAGNMDEAIMQFMRTMDLDPDYTEAHFWMGVCYQRLGEPAHAVIEWEKFLERHPDSDRAEAVKKLLAEAKAQDAASPVHRLGPQPETQEKKE
jgi:TolB-like protein